MSLNPLKNPWMIAVWPGMGNVAINAGVYLLSQLQMSNFADFHADELFDLDSIVVKKGLIQPVRRPRNQFFVRRDPKEKRDLIVFLGESQPPAGKLQLCQRLISFAIEHGVQRIFTFAAMATQMHPEHPARVFVADTSQEGLAELKNMVDLLEDGHIGGLNGVLLGVAQERGLRGTCLLGEMPHIFHQLPFPKASLVILETFSLLSGVECDLAPLAEQARSIDQQLGAFLARIEKQLTKGEGEEEQGVGQEAEQFSTEAPDVRISTADRAEIERLFSVAIQDRSKAFELKQFLDRLDAFKEYEDRFLDLFKSP